MLCSHETISLGRLGGVDLQLGRVSLRIWNAFAPMQLPVLQLLVKRLTRGRMSAHGIKKITVRMRHSEGRRKEGSEAGRKEGREEGGDVESWL